MHCILSKGQAPTQITSLSLHGALPILADRKDLFRRLQELNPHPTTELEYRTPFELLVAVALSAQATDIGVNKATRKLFPRSEEHTSELQSRENLVCRLLLEKKKIRTRL